MTLLLFENAGDPEPSASIVLDSRRHRTGDIWHVRLVGDLGGKLYALQADGPHAPAKGHVFDPHRVLLDPYAGAVAGLAGDPGRTECKIRIGLLAETG